jgi:hypothetical protein
VTYLRFCEPPLESRGSAGTPMYMSGAYTYGDSFRTHEQRQCIRSFMHLLVISTSCTCLPGIGPVCGAIFFPGSPQLITILFRIYFPLGGGPSLSTEVTQALGLVLDHQGPMSVLGNVVASASRCSSTAASSRRSTSQKQRTTSPLSGARACGDSYRTCEQRHCMELHWFIQVYVSTFIPLVQALAHHVCGRLPLPTRGAAFALCITTLVCLSCQVMWWRFLRIGGATVDSGWPAAIVR